VAVIYFSPRLFCRFDLAARAISIRRRIASEQQGLSLCCLVEPYSISGAAVVPALRPPFSFVTKNGRSKTAHIPFSVSLIARFNPQKSNSWTYCLLITIWRDYLNKFRHPRCRDGRSRRR
jgi:hypothetical protein